MPTIVEQRLAAYCHAKDFNRPHLMAQAFADDAWLETAVDSDVVSLPSIAQGREAITRALVRHFGRTYENVYTFCLQRPRADWQSTVFSCDWLAGMSLKDSGQVRIGCGRYDWRFQAEPPHLVQGLKITIATMKVLSPAAQEAAIAWLAGLNYPWCPAEQAIERAPALPSLKPVLDYLQRRHDAAARHLRVTVLHA